MRILLLPFIEQTAVYNNFDVESKKVGQWSCVWGGIGSIGEPTWGYKVKIDTYICPSDGKATAITNKFGEKGSAGRANVMFCVGDSTWGNQRAAKYDGNPKAHVSSRGMFAPETWHGLEFCTDGTSNTIGVAEGCSGDNRETSVKGGVALVGAMWDGNNSRPGPCLSNGYKANDRTQVVETTDTWRGTFWYDGRTQSAGFSTNVPPNSVLCAWSNSYPWIAGGASSYHSGGVNAAMMDGSVRFISDTIDTGNLNSYQVSSGKSPYGVWGALGTPQGGETVTL